MNVSCLREEPRGDVDVFLTLLANCFNNCFVDFIPGLSLFDVYILDVGVWQFDEHIVLPHTIAYAIAVVRGRTKFCWQVACNDAIVTAYYGQPDRRLTVSSPLQTPPRPGFYKLRPASKTDHLCQSWTIMLYVHGIQTVYN